MRNPLLKARRNPLLKGEGPGHPFRGNQYTEGGGDAAIPDDQKAAADALKERATLVSALYGAQPGIDKIIAAHGRAYRFDKGSFTGTKRTAHQCFRCAFQDAMTHNRTYVEGYVSVHGVPIHHAWTVDKSGRVYDPTLQPDSINAVKGYFGVPLKQDYVERTALKTKVYGVLSHTNRDIFTEDKPENYVAKGDLPGHPFRGNQYATGQTEGVTVYHGTRDTVVQSILKDGIKAVSKERNFHTSPDAHHLYFDDRGRSVYVTPNRYKAQFYAQSAAARVPGAKPVLLELKVPKSQWSKLVADEWDLAGHRTKGTDIPPAWIVKATAIEPGLVGSDLGSKVLYQKDDGHVTAYVVIFVHDPEDEQEAVDKGEGPGHPFRGNQWTALEGVTGYRVERTTGVNSEPIYTVRDHKGSYVGEARLSHTLDYVVDLGVAPDHRRKGIASALYNHIEADLGRPLKPSPVYQTEAGRAFWAARVKKGEGPGHPFRGNQYVDGEGGGSGDDSQGWLRAAREAVDANGNTVKDLLNSGAPAAQIESHPALVAARNYADSIPSTEARPDYGTSHYRAHREFVTPEGRLTGYRQAEEYLMDKAASYARGPLARGSEATIILGPPASGKSTFAESIAERTGSAIIDADDAKAIFPEYKGGIGANAVHEESSVLAGAVLSRYLGNGYNIVLPKVGGSKGSIERLTTALKAQGYQVNLVNMNVSEENAFRRATSRFLSSGRLISHTYTKEVDGNPKRTYDALKSTGQYQHTVEIDANPPKGQHVITEGVDTPLGQILKG